MCHIQNPGVSAEKTSSSCICWAGKWHDWDAHALVTAWWNVCLHTWLKDPTPGFIFLQITLLSPHNHSCSKKKKNPKQASKQQQNPPEYLTSRVRPLFGVVLEPAVFMTKKKKKKGQFFKWPSWKRIFLVNDLFLFLLCCFSWSLMTKTCPSKLVYSLWITNFNYFL